MSTHKKKAVAGFAIFVLIAIAVVSLIFVASWVGKVFGQVRQLSRVNGMVDFYLTLDDKGTEFSFLESKKDGYGFTETLGALGSGMKTEGDFRLMMTSLEQSLDRLRNNGRKDYYIAVLDSTGKIVYEKKSGEMPFVEGGFEDLFLKWPIEAKDSVISSGFGWRLDPTIVRESGGNVYKQEFHGGIDIVSGNQNSVLGDSVFSATDGRVVSAGFENGGFGNSVVVEYVSPNSKTTYRIYYNHLSSISVSAGSVVKAGDKIGEAGNTGRSTGPHLHFEVVKDENGDGTYARDIESVNLCPYLATSGGGMVNPNQCLKDCTTYENPAACGAAVAVVANRFDIPLVGGKKGSVELMLWQRA
jgi:hypothetical protein